MAMGRQELKIAVEGLELDMFVARLDRPWLGTSFPFQGFQLQTEADLKLLQRICTHVYVDVDAGRAPHRRFIEPNDALIRKVRAVEQIAGLRKTTWINQGTLQDELPNAQTAHTMLQRGISEVAEDLRNGRDLDLDKLTPGMDAMIESITRHPSAFIWLKELKRKDGDAYRHALGSSVWAATFGRNLGLERSDLGELALAGLLCDIGKIRVRPELLGRAGALDPAEMVEVRQHVQAGLDILTKTPGLPHTVLDAVATHHERHDGSRYPHGLQGVETPMFGRIMASSTATMQ